VSVRAQTPTPCSTATHAITAPFVRKPPPLVPRAGAQPLKTTVAPCACAAVTLTEIFEAFNSLLLSTSRSTALSFVTRTVRFVSATRCEPW